MADDELVKKFVELHAQTEQLLHEDKISEAKQKYLDVVNAYHDIEKSSLEHFHKELAYDQVTQLFKKVNEAKQRVQVPYNLILAAVLIIGFSILVVFKPSIVGLAGFEDLIRQPTDFVFTEPKLQQVTLKDRPLTLSASGEFSGKAKLFYKKGDKFELIFDSEKSKSQNGIFTDICEETCEIIADSNAIELFADVTEGSRLHIKELSYKVKRKDNTAPTWTGKTKTFTAIRGKTLTIDVNQYFTDAENDKLVYLSTTDDGLDVLVQNSKVSITPKTAGTKHIVFIASDLLDVTKVPVTIEVK
ncbi:MAG: hypothetical protein QW165_02005 [Candidatus Woesearchaeota archaeon]